MGVPATADVLCESAITVWHLLQSLLMLCRRSHMLAVVAAEAAGV